MKKMKENPLEHKTISPYTMEGYLYVQEKRECQDHQQLGLRSCLLPRRWRAYPPPSRPVMPGPELRCVNIGFGE